MKPEIQPRAHKNESVIINTLRRVTGKAVAEKMEVSETTISRFKNGELKEWCGFLAALGLKVVGESLVCRDPEEFEAAMVFARRYMNLKSEMKSEAAKAPLSWDDGE